MAEMTAPVTLNQLRRQGLLATGKLLRPSWRLETHTITPFVPKLLPWLVKGQGQLRLAEAS